MPTTLIVKPIDLSAPGSYKVRKRFLRLLIRLQESQADRDPVATLKLMEEIDELLVARLRTEDGSPVEDALDELSANQFDQLLSSIAFENSVGEANGEPSNAGIEGSPKKSRRGKSK